MRVGNYTLQIKHAPPKDLAAGTRKSPLVFQALRFLGKAAITDEVVRTIHYALTPDDRRQLLNDARYATDWVCDAAQKIASFQEPPANG